MITRSRNRALWSAQVLLALIFGFAGIMKLTLPIEALTQQIHFPGGFLRFLGAAEVCGALGMILPGLLRIRPALTALAAACLVPIVAAATVITIAIGQIAGALLPFVTCLLAAFVAWGRSRPGVFRVERSSVIQASPDRIFPLIADFRRWAAWSPYERLDAAMTKTYSGAPYGVGAIYQWAGNNKVGAGRMEIVSTTVPSKVTIQLDFLKPFEGHQTAEFTLAAGGGATTVTWATFGPTNTLLLLMSIFVSMDRLIGKEFELGLENLKSIAEQKTATLV